MARIRTSSSEQGRVASGRRVRAGSSKAETSIGRRERERRSEPLPSLTVSRPELLTHGSDGEFRRLVHGLFSFMASHEEIRAGHARVIGLAGIEYTVLISIAHLAQGGDVSVSGVAQHLRLTGAFITNVCNRLVSLGLVDKSVDANDRRRVVLTVTTEGRHRLAKLAPTQRQVNDVEFGCLSAKEFAGLVDIIERLVESGEKAVALQRYLAQGK